MPNFKKYLLHVLHVCVILLLELQVQLCNLCLHFLCILEYTNSSTLLFLSCQPIPPYAPSGLAWALLEISFLLLVTDWCYILATKVISTPDFSVFGFDAFVHFDPMQILCLLHRDSEYWWLIVIVDNTVAMDLSSCLCFACTYLLYVEVCYAMVYMSRSENNFLQFSIFCLGPGNLI